VILSAKLPFEVTGTKADKAELVVLRATQSGGEVHVIEATVHAPEQPGVYEGSISVLLNLVGETEIALPYYLAVKKGE
jgi:hypothetical protein